MACKGLGRGACGSLEKGDWYGSSKQASTPGRAHGGQVRAQEGLDRQVPLQLGRDQRPGDCHQRRYESKASAINGIESVKRNAPNAEIDDQTDK
jgi:hypothetical protein